jgi:hypothetical protein
MPKHDHLTSEDTKALRHYFLFIADSMRSDMPVMEMEGRITQMQQRALKVQRETIRRD